MSSSRVHMTLTGAPIALESSTASLTKSHLDLRPKAPPSRVTWTLTCVGSSPVSAAASCCTDCGFWVGAQISQRSAVTWARACGVSIGAWASSGV